VILEKLPITSNGKIDRKALPAPEPKRASSESFYIAPRTPTEDVLAAIWCEVLGVKEIGVHDNFFALGGHSLQVTQLLAKIERLFDQRVSVPVFFLNPTVEGLSRALQDQDTSGHRLIHLTKGSAPGTLFFLDAGVGQCRLARLLKVPLASFATVISFQDLTLEASHGESTNTSVSVESMAAAHVALIRNAPRSGPCLLVGHSFGGTIAFEVAHQLRREDIAVEMIILLDAWRKSPPSTLKSSLWRRVKTTVAVRSRLLRLAARLGSIKAGPARYEDDFAQRYEPSDVPAHFYLKLRENYCYRPLDIRAILLRTSDSTPRTMEWDDLFSRGLDVVETPGDHWTLLKEPHLQALALKIDDRLEYLAAREASMFQHKISAGAMTNLIAAE
jgi:thioesterase domain-containing protein